MDRDAPSDWPRRSPCCPQQPPEVPKRNQGACFAGSRLDAAGRPRVWLKKRLFDVKSNKVTGSVSQADDLVPVARSGGIGANQRAKSHRDAPRPWHHRFVSQNLPRASHGHRADRPSRVDGSLECAQLEGTYSRDGRKSALRINHHGFAALERRIHFLRLLDSRLRIVAIEREMAAALAEPSEERHL